MDRDYQLGLENGFIDGCVLDETSNELEKVSVAYKYNSWISKVVTQTKYTIGYARGIIAAAVYLGATR